MIAAKVIGMERVFVTVVVCALMGGEKVDAKFGEIQHGSSDRVAKFGVQGGESGAPGPTLKWRSERSKQDAVDCSRANKILFFACVVRIR